MGILNIELLFPRADIDGAAAGGMTITDLGSGLYRISGPDSVVSLLDADHYQLNSSHVIDHEDGTFTATSG
jgi:hypothetical protein